MTDCNDECILGAATLMADGYTQQHNVWQEEVNQ